MYDVIMQLPILQGIGKKRMSDILERTKIGFRKYSSGEKIISHGEEQKDVIYIISGSARRRWKMDDQGLCVCERMMPLALVNGSYLYGIDKRIPYDLTAAGSCVIFSFPREQLLENLMMDQVLLINYLNFLSLRTQRPVASLLDFHGDFFFDWLCSLLLSVVDSKSVDIELEFTEDLYCAMVNAKGMDVERKLTELRTMGLLEFGNNRISILSIQELVEELSHRNN